MAGNHIWTDRGIREWERIRDKVDGFRGTGVVNKPGEMSIHIQPGKKASPAPNRPPSVIKYGTLASAWASGDKTVELTPCKSEADNTATGEDNVNPKIFADFTTAAGPFHFKASVGDILAYVKTGNDYVLFSPPIDLVVGASKYQVFQMLDAAAAGWDWVRAHT